MNALARIDTFPRERLALLPTPLVPAPRLGRAIGLPQLWIKHDELIGFGFGGNKLRGLELLLADAKGSQADVLVTGAGAQSNHVRATAACAAYAGMDAIAVYWGSEPAAVQGNLLLTRLLGGYRFARTMHFYLAMGFVAFFFVHIVQVIKAGWSNFRTMIVGYDLVTVPDPISDRHVPASLAAAGPAVAVSQEVGANVEQRLAVGH